MNSDTPTYMMIAPLILIMVGLITWTMCLIWSQSPWIVILLVVLTFWICFWIYIDTKLESSNPCPIVPRPVKY